MPIIGNNITEVRVKIDTQEAGKLEGVQNNMLIADIEEKKMDKQTLLIMKCNLVATYVKEEKKPLAQFMVAEEIVFSGDDKDIKEIVKEWKDNKKLPSKFEKGIIEGINTICMYDLQFFTNRMRFPPATGFNLNVTKDSKDKKSKK